MVRNRGRLLAAAGIILVLVAAVVTVALFVSKRKKQAGVAAPGFVLRDQQDRPTSLAQFRGKVVVLTFVDPECTQICPLTTQSMVEALKILGPAAASQVQLLGVDANPLKTQVADVAAYTRSHGLQGHWRFLTGSRAQLERVWHSYHIYVAAANNDITHEAVVFLIDGNGNERTLFPTPMSYGAIGEEAQALAKGIARLLPGRPAVAISSEASRELEKPLKPTETVSLRAIGPKRQPVVLGGDHPHLILFFARWLGKGPDLLKNLTELDAYGTLAKRQGWPPPVAVDELTTEPSPTETRQALTSMSATLHTLLIEDASGQLADGYAVEDLPSFVLTSPWGTILWRHNGWLPAAVLGQDVRAALAKLTEGTSPSAGISPKRAQGPKPR